jgi:hypothetical protein
MAAPLVLDVDGRHVTITHPDKVIFPEAGYTKADLVLYYLDVADAAELVAIDVFASAQAAGEPVTMTLMKRTVAELLAHEPRCECGRPGDAHRDFVWQLLGGVGQWGVVEAQHFPRHFDAEDGAELVAIDVCWKPPVHFLVVARSSS